MLCAKLLPFISKMHLFFPTSKAINVNAVCNLFKVETRLENPTRLYMLQSQKRQVKQFLSSGEIEYEHNNICGNYNKMTGMDDNHHHGICSLQPTKSNLLAPPTLNYPSLTSSAPAKNCPMRSNDNSLNSRDVIDQGEIYYYYY